MPKQELKAPMAEMKKCAGRAKTKLFQLKHETLRKYYLEECAKSGVFPVKAIKGIAPRIPLGEPTGKERYKITMRAYGVAQTKIRKEFYDLYLEFYNAELSRSGLSRNKDRWASLTKIDNLEAEVKRLQSLISECTCGFVRKI